MQKIHQHSAGIDIGARNIYIGIEGEQVAVFGTFTQDFKDAVSYLLSHGIRTVAMEATGSYWIILFDVLQAAGLDVWLVDGRQTRQVPGRKTGPDIHGSWYLRKLARTWANGKARNTLPAGWAYLRARTIQVKNRGVNQKGNQKKVRFSGQ